MTDKIFFIDYHNKTYSYFELFQSVINTKNLNKYIYSQSYFDIFCNIITSIYHDKPIVLLDYKLSYTDLERLDIISEYLQETYKLNNLNFDFKTFLDFDLSQLSDWSLTLYTSGTTGKPKKIQHPINSLIKAVKKTSFYEDNVWGLAYNPTHIAGIQVFFQAFLNRNTIVDLFTNIEQNEIINKIESFNVTHISSTPTYYKLLYNNNRIINNIKRITIGGEKSTPNLYSKLKTMFPKAKLLNIYASTEAGSMLNSSGDIFIIEDKDNFKIQDGILYIKSELLGKNDFVSDEWYNTGDLVEVVHQNPLKIKIIGRADDMVNVGGYKVNTNEVEEVISSLPYIISAKVFVKKNSVTGNLLCADIQTSDVKITTKQIKQELKKLLSDFKIPRIINIVDHIELTNSGKIKKVQ